MSTRAKNVVVAMVSRQDPSIDMHDHVRNQNIYINRLIKKGTTWIKMLSASPCVRFPKHRAGIVIIQMRGRDVLKLNMVGHKWNAKK